MKQEFKWILSIELEVEESVDPERRYTEARYALELAQDAFFDSLSGSNQLSSWVILSEELK